VPPRAAALKYLVERQGFSVQRSIKTAANAAMVLQLADAYLYKTTADWPRPFRYLMSAQKAT
jgi:hypothetical protein